jgi:3-methylcrotonyl-CoA carboxylase alpha subunit
MIYEYNGEPMAISLEPLGDGRYRVTLGDREVIIAAVPIDGGWLMTLDGQQMRLYAASGSGAIWTAVDGETYRLSVPETRRRSSTARGDLDAQMPGQVRDVFVQAGDSVKSGQTLLVLEAMKMEIRVSAPADGLIRRLLVKAGDVVDRGQRLVEME